MPRSITFLLALVLVLGGCASSGSMDSGDDAPSMPSVSPEVARAQEILAQHTAALGGMQAIDALETLHYVGMTEMMGTEISLDMYQKRPGKMRMDIYVPSADMEITQAFDGDSTAWMMNPAAGGTQKIEGPQAASFRQRGLQFASLLLDLDAQGVSATFVADTTLDEQPMHHLALMTADSSITDVFLDAETYLIYKTVAEGVNPMSGEPAVQETQYIDYRPVNGVQIAHVNKIYINGLFFQELIFEDVKPNPDLDDSMFAYPDN